VSVQTAMSSSGSGRKEVTARRVPDSWREAVPCECVFLFCIDVFQTPLLTKHSDKSQQKWNRIS